MAQSEWVNWSSIRLHTREYNGYSFGVKPIMRHNRDLENYANTSLDLIFAKSFKNGWKFQYLYRYWWEDDRPNRIFWWFDVSNRLNLGPRVIFGNRMRWHISLDSRAPDPNFLRYLPTITIKVEDKLSVYGGSEIWYQLDDVNDLRRFRHQAGVNWNWFSRSSLNLQYWYEKSRGLVPGFLFHTIVININYRL